MDKNKLDESSGYTQEIIEKWKESAEGHTLETLPEFLRELTEEYEHDYGTICHAMAVGAVATAWAMNASPQGSITGFQAGAVMWEFIRGWCYRSNVTGLKLVDYDNMLYPQYSDKFARTIPDWVFEKLQERAKELLKESPDAASPVRDHWQSIVDGTVPFGYAVVQE